MYFWMTSEKNNLTDHITRLRSVYFGFFSIFLIGITFGHFLPPGPFEYGPGLAQHLLTWDGVWYRDIAEHGYRWNAAVGMRPRRYQNIAFFPLYPLIERLIMEILGTHDWEATILPGFVFGLLSISSFDRLARQTLPNDQAALKATAFYAFWPAICFYGMGYPTGLINLCVIESVSAYSTGRFIRAALWSGLGTAAAPTVVFVAMGLCVDRGLKWFQSSRNLLEVPGLILFGALSVFGLLFFMAYLGLQFGNPLLFINAQKAWAVPKYLIAPESLKIHLLLSVFPIWYFFPFYQTFSFLIKIINIHYYLGNKYINKYLNHFFQIDIDVLSVFLLIYSIFIFRKNEKYRIFCYTGFFLLAGYIWFFGSTYNQFINGIRLLFPAFIIFLALGSFDYKKLSFWKFLLSVIYALACIEIGLVWSGYIVI